MLKYLQERSWAAIKLHYNQEIPKPERVEFKIELLG